MNVKEDHIDNFIGQMNELGQQSHIDYIDGDAENGPRHGVPAFQPMTRKDFVIDLKATVGNDFMYAVTHYLCDQDGFEFYLTGYYQGEELNLTVQNSHEGVSYWTSGQLWHAEKREEVIPHGDEEEPRSRV